MSAVGTNGSGRTYRIGGEDWQRRDGRRYVRVDSTKNQHRELGELGYKLQSHEIVLVCVVLTLAYVIRQPRLVLM